MKKYLFLFFLLFSSVIYSQTRITISSDFVSTYMYCGTNIGGNSPHIQPTVKYNYIPNDSVYKNTNFELGIWGSIGTNNKYREFDLYATLTVKNISVSFYKIYVPYLPDGTPISSNISLLNNEPFTTAYQDEVIFSYNGSEKIPFTFIIETYIYGNDRDYGYNLNLDKKHLSYFSTYIEGNYSTNLLNQNIKVFTGITTHPGMFGDKFGFVNIGLTDNYKVKINKLEIPVFGTFIYNPMINKPFFVLGVTLKII